MCKGRVWWCLTDGVDTNKMFEKKLLIGSDKLTYPDEQPLWSGQFSTVWTAKLQVKGGERRVAVKRGTRDSLKEKERFLEEPDILQ